MNTATTTPVEEAARTRFDLRLTGPDAAEQAALIRQAAVARRQSVSDFIFSAAVTEAEKAVVEGPRLELLAEIYDRLAAEVEEPGQVVAAMVEMAKKSRPGAAD